MSIVFKPEMALILGKTEAELDSFEAEGMPGVSMEERPGTITVKRYDTALIITWYIERSVRRRLAH